MIEPFINSLKQPLNRIMEKHFLHQMTLYKHSGDQEGVALKSKAHEMKTLKKKLPKYKISTVVVASEACQQDEWGCLGDTSDGICQLAVLKDKQVTPQQKRGEASTTGQRFVTGR